VRVKPTIKEIDGEKCWVVERGGFIRSKPKNKNLFSFSDEDIW
jgi:hypothetical protein